MADFTKAINPVLVSEGGYVDDPDDRGGETVRGISRKHHPDWRGWIQVDGIKEARSVDIKIMIEQYFENGEGYNLILDFYIEKYWFFISCFKKWGVTKYPPFASAEYARTNCIGVISMPCPKDAVA